jgi:membrane protein DedA with SNARE-associated domain
VLTQILNPILSMQGLPVYLIVGALVFAEAAIFLGFVFPGETAAILGGVIASKGHVSLPLLMGVVVLCAIGGDTVGYWVGHRFGERLLLLPMLRRRRRSVDAAVAFLRRRGAFAVFAGRFTAFLRAVVPGLAGLSRMRYRIFLAANAAGGLCWGVTFTLVGYFVGQAYQRAEQVASWASWAVLGLVLLGYSALIVRGRRRERRFEAEMLEGSPDGDGPAAAVPESEPAPSALGADPPSAE